MSKEWEPPPSSYRDTILYLGYLSERAHGLDEDAAMTLHSLLSHALVHLESHAEHNPQLFARVAPHSDEWPSFIGPHPERGKRNQALLKRLGVDAADERVNPNGGAIALGHPLGCSGAKLTATALHELRRRDARYAMVTMCIGTGMGAAGIFERL